MLSIRKIGFDEFQWTAKVLANAGSIKLVENTKKMSGKIVRIKIGRLIFEQIRGNDDLSNSLKNKENWSINTLYKTAILS